MLFWTHYQLIKHQNIVPPKEHAVGTAVILEFLLCRLDFSIVVQY